MPGVQDHGSQIQRKRVAHYALPFIFAVRVELHYMSFVFHNGDMDIWDDIKTEYITTGIGTRPLAAKYKVSYSTLRKRAAREQWAQERAQFR